MQKTVVDTNGASDRNMNPRGRGKESLVNAMLIALDQRTIHRRHVEQHLLDVGKASAVVRCNLALLILGRLEGMRRQCRSPKRVVFVQTRHEDVEILERRSGALERDG